MGAYEGPGLPPSNLAPELVPIEDQVVVELGSLVVPASASDPDDDPIELWVEDLPAFAGFVDNQDGTGTIQFDPLNDDSGYYFVTVNASDGLLTDTTSFTVEVTNSNQAPDIDPIPNQDMNAGDSLTVRVFASDPDPGPLSMSADNLPPFAVFTDLGDGEATIELSPGDDVDDVFPRSQ